MEKSSHITITTKLTIKYSTRIVTKDCCIPSLRIWVLDWVVQGWKTTSEWTCGL